MRAVQSLVELYRGEGLAAVIRQIAPEEPPPPGSSAAEIWAGVRRADTALAVVLLLVEDMGVAFEATLAVVERATRFRGGLCVGYPRAALEAVHGEYLTAPRKAELLRRHEAFAAEWQAFMANLLQVPVATVRSAAALQVPELWEPQAYAAAHQFVQTVGLIGHVPKPVLRAKLEEVGSFAHKAVTLKLRDVDKLPEAEALRLANEDLVAALRRVVSHELFGVRITGGSIATQN